MVADHKRCTSISVIMPVYNEPKLLRPAVETIDSFMQEHFDTYEILVIESGSTDDTGAQCDALAKENARVNVIHEGGRNGFGSALKLGYRHAKYAYCWLVTAEIKCWSGCALGCECDVSILPISCCLPP